MTKTRVQTIAGTPVWVTGHGPTIIFIHGVMLDHRMWQPQIDALSPHYRVCCLDMLGHGAAPDPDGERTLDDFVAQARDIVDHFSNEGPPVLVGFSMGGLITQKYAARYHDRLAGIIVMNAVHDRTPQESARVIARYEANVAEGVDNAIQSGLTRWFRPHERKAYPDLPDQVASWMRDGDFKAKLKAHRVFVTSDAEVTGQLGTISCPALIMAGQDDAGSTPAMARKMTAAIPDAELHILKGQHHMMPTLAADEVNEIVLKFLARC